MNFFIQRPIFAMSIALVMILAGANSRRSLGTTVVGGLTVATILIIFVPIFYYVIERVRERKTPQRTKKSAPKDGQVATNPDIKTKGA